MSYILTEERKEYVRDKIIIGAKKYGTSLIGKIFLIVCEDDSRYEVQFSKKAFKHLTGLKSDLNDNNFFDNCFKTILSTGNIKNEQKYNWATLKSKVDRIEQIDNIIYADVDNSLFMINLHTNTGNYPVAIRNTNMNVCIGFRETIYTARTLRKSTNSTNADMEKKISVIYSKSKSEIEYTNIIYKSSKT